MAGLGEKASLLQSIVIGITNLVFTFVGLWLIDRAGRRTLLLIGSLGYIVSLGLCVWAFATQSFSYVPACIFAFFTGMMVLQLLWVLTMVPETKGVPLEQLAEQLQG